VFSEIKSSAERRFETLYPSLLRSRYLLIDDFRYIPIDERAAFLQAGDVIEFLIKEGTESLPLARAYHTASAKAMDVKNYDKAMEYCEIEVRQKYE